MSQQNDPHNVLTLYTTFLTFINHRGFQKGLQIDIGVYVDIDENKNKLGQGASGKSTRMCYAHQKSLQVRFAKK